MAYLACPRARGGDTGTPGALAWWTLAVAVRSGYTPLTFGGRRLWAATADAALLFAIMARYSLLAREVDQAAALLAVPKSPGRGSRPC
ncbi:MAG TPA: tryptophan-rich sensory protein [Trebonia sp.]